MTDLQQRWKKIENKLGKLYPSADPKQLVLQLKEVVKAFRKQLSTDQDLLVTKEYELTQKDAALITYADSIICKSKNVSPLQTLTTFIKKYNLDQVTNTAHILPFYPWDTDRGFSVTDYFKVDPRNGSWQDVEELGKLVRLMFDFVANHASVDNPLIQGALIERHLDKSDSRYQDYVKYKDFVMAFSDEQKPTDEELKSLARPRPNPVLTRYTVFENQDRKLRAILGKPSKEKRINILSQGWVWTTFSRPKRADGSEDTRQVDLNFANPQLFLETIRILLFYVGKSAAIIRLDAIGYIWKRLGSTSLHEPEAHIILEVIKDFMEIVATGIMTIAEVNERQSKVWEYLGKPDHEESDMVYQFTQYTLAIHAIWTENNHYYHKWLKTLETAHGKQFVTVLGSHDSSAFKPLRDVMPEEEIQALGDYLVQKFGGLPNLATLPGGKKVYYEVCATPWHLINNPNEQERLELQLNRYLAVVALGLLVRGLPAFYINGLIGAPNYQPEEGLDENRTTNRQVFEDQWLYQQLDDKKSHMHQVFTGLTDLLKIRSQHSAFNPHGPAAEPVDISNKQLVSALMKSPDKKEWIWCVTNLSKTKQITAIDANKLDSKLIELRDLISSKCYRFNRGSTSLELAPYQTLWLKG